ncbi:MAG: FAD-dependent oxidoreductase [Acidimicrobiia bacterium]|nr:FAD-dependent oxidoreductase [Acidimicrobiia bacterium]MYK56770.1 FAD-dependent oxidoreductase [Acidimicrobiia bacterium]
MVIAVGHPPSNSDRKESVVVVGAGIFGLAGALELERRGYDVTLVNAGPIPHASAASNDVSRMVRMDYGADRLHCRLGSEAISGWRRWNARWGRDLYHQDGLLFLSSGPLEEESFEGHSYRTLSEEGWSPERLGSEEIATRYPGWNADYYIDGYFNQRGGWAEATAVVSLLAGEARARGICVKTEAVAEIARGSGRVTGVIAADGTEIRADRVVAAAGVWTPSLLPELDGFIRLSGQPLLYIRPADPEPFRPPRFPPWGADIATTGWYGFPANREGIVKIGIHGPGYSVSPDAPRVPPGDEDEARCRDFLSHSLPALADAPLHAVKMCVYTDTFDGDFLISRHPGTEGLTVASGGSGHGFKFGPVLGRLIADAVEGIPNPYLDRYAWRSVGDPATEASRYVGE